MGIPEFEEIWFGLAVSLVIGGWLQARLSTRQHIYLVGVILFISLIPLLYGISLAQLFRGILGSLSVTTLVLLVFWNLRSTDLYKNLDKQKHLFIISIAVIALPFYWAALGGAPIDPYNWGFSDWRLLGGFAVIGLAMWYRGNLFFPGILMAAIFAHAIQLLESNNLWDYLFDPALAIYAIVVSFRTATRVLTQHWKRLQA